MALGFIIFGWPRRTKEFGPAFQYQCPACEKNTYHHYTRARRWGSIFFIPLIPLWTASFYATCENCGFTEEIESKSEAKLYKRGAKLNGKYLDNAIDDREYWEEMESLIEASEYIQIQDQDDIETQELAGEQEIEPEQPI